MGGFGNLQQETSGKRTREIKAQISPDAASAGIRPELLWRKRATRRSNSVNCVVEARFGKPVSVAICKMADRR